MVETAGGIAPDGSRIELTTLRAPPWKLIHAPALARFELYDLAHDPSERENRWAAAPQAATLGAELAAFASRIPPAPSAPAGDPALHSKLRALGYVE